jgi:putative DNA methylase
MIWEYAEANPFSESSGSLNVLVEGQARAMRSALDWHSRGCVGHVEHLDVLRNSFPVRPIVVSTDPPYYDNVGYADLSDFFYVWLKQSLGSIWPNLFRRLTTPKAEELVATPARHGGKKEASSFFMKGMSEALTAMRNASTETEPLAIYYAFKQSEASEDGITSAGWASFLQAVVDAGLLVDGTWPMRTENASRMRGQSSNALASSIVLVCRKRTPDAKVVTRAEFIRSLKRELPQPIDDIRKAGIGPVDMQQSVIGPGMGVFSRYAKVLEDDDSAMPVKTALSLINRVWEEIENELDTNFDAETQVALAWFATYGFDAKPSGELITLANAKNIALGTLFASGVFSDGKGKAGLTARADLPDDWSPASDNALTVWECVQHTARVLNAEDGGGEAAAKLVAEIGPKAADARALAYRLYEIASQKGWAAEALIYNELAQEWPKLEELASTATARSAKADAQASLF